MELARLHHRILAFLIDYIIITIFFLILMSFSSNDVVIKIILASTVSILSFFYFVISEYKYGYTIGKKLVKIKVQNLSGKQITLKQALIRNLLRIIDSLPMFYIVGIISILITKNRQRVGDILAKTIMFKFK